MSITIDRAKLPTDSRHTLARLRLLRMQMRRDGKLLLVGAPFSTTTDVRETWLRAGWTPPRRTE